MPTFQKIQKENGYTSKIKFVVADSRVYTSLARAQLNKAKCHGSLFNKQAYLLKGH